MRHPTLDFLRHARRRWLLRSLLRTSLVAMLAGSTILLGVRVAERVRFFAQPLTPPETAWASLVVVALTFLVTFGIALWRTPSLIALGHLVDRSAGLDNRLATGAELALSSGPKRSLVARAAVDDSNDCVHALAMRQVLPIQAPWWTWLIPFVAGPALAMSVLNVAPNAVPPSSTNEVPAVVDSAEMDREPVDIDAVRRVAELLGREASANDDQYLRAVGEAFKEFVRDLDAAGEDAAELRSDLDPLLDHLSRAVADREDEVGRLLRELAESGLRRATEPSQGDHAEVGADPPAGAPELMQYSESVRAPRSANEILDELDRATRMEAVRAAEAAAAAANASDMDDMFYGGLFDEPGAPRTPSGVAQDGEAAGAPIGAAERSDDRAGDAAGDGRSDSEREGTNGAFDAIEVDVDTIELQDANPDETGSRAESDGLTERFTPATDVERIQAPEVSGPAHRTSEGRIGAERSGTKYDSAVSRYFLPSDIPLEGP